jgi:hypothetical protein
MKHGVLNDRYLYSFSNCLSYNKELGFFSTKIERFHEQLKRDNIAEISKL